MNRLAKLTAGALMLLGTAASAQVGFTPTQSPYLDLEHAQELTLFGGYFHGHRDPADVAPGGGFLTGLRYQWRAGGPALIIGELSRASSNSRVLNPFVVGTGRDLGTISRPLYSGSVGLGLSLTGGKSWHHIVPELATGLGFISDFRSQPDTGGFKFGTRFALNWGGGIRWVPGGSWSIRGDITNKLYTMSYPEAYFVPSTGVTPVVASTQARSFWTNNPAFTLGVSRLF